MQLGPSVYDHFLNRLVDSAAIGEYFEIRYSSEPTFIPDGISYDSMSAIMDFFIQKGFIENCFCSGYSEIDYVISASVTIKGYEFHRIGGFVFQEKLLVDSFRKLELELNGLKISAPDRVGRITGIMSDISALIQGVAVFMK